MPVRIWTRRRVSDALPNTYHQPIGPAASRGIGCRIIGSRVSRRRRRASNQLPTARSQRIMAGSPSCESSRSGRTLQRVVERWEVRRLDLQHVEATNSRDAIDAGIETARRWAGGVVPIGVVDAAVTGAHEQAGLGEPLD